MFIPINPNPDNNLTVDCTVRAISIATGEDWDTIYLRLAVYGFRYKDMPSSNRIVHTLLYDLGFRRYIIPDTCPDCYTVRRFCDEHPNGTYILSTGTHVVAVISGNYFDTWDSGYETIIFCYRKEVF